MWKSRNDWEPVSPATGREGGEGRGCFIFEEGTAWSEASWLGARPILQAKCLGALTTDQGLGTIKRDPSSPTPLKNPMVSYFFITSLINDPGE